MSSRRTSPRRRVVTISQVEGLHERNKELLASSAFDETTILNHMRDLVIAGRTTSDLDEKDWVSATARFWSGQLYFNTGRDIVPLVYISEGPETNLMSAKESSGGLQVSISARLVSLIPLGNRLVIKPIVQEEVLASGIVIPDTAKEKPQQGEVIAVGPGRLDDDGKRIAMDVEVGDCVLYSKYSGQEVPRGVLTSEEEDFLVLKEPDILAKLR